jgi:hypothetical protein
MAVADGVAGAGTDWKQDLVSLSVLQFDLYSPSWFQNSPCGRLGAMGLICCHVIKYTSPTVAMTVYEPVNHI